jgi:hypothetical protein
MNTTTDHSMAWQVQHAVATHLSAHEAASARELESMLAACVAGWQPEPDGTALRQQLARLADSGHVHRVTVGGQPRWKQGPGPLAARIATARRVLRLDTSVYSPPEAGAPVRPGAMDFARIPSLLLGHRSDYWGTSQ